MTHRLLTSTALAAALGLAAGAAGAQEIRFMCYSDGNECAVYDELLTRFEEQNEGVDVVVDEVPYQAIVENLRYSSPPAPGRTWPRSPTPAG